MKENERLEAGTDAATLGARLRETREYLGLSQQFVADRTGLPRSAISEIEHGKRGVESLELARFARLYRHPVSHFISDEPPGAEEDPMLRALARAADELSSNDRRELLRFAEFLRNYAGAQEEPGR